MGKRGGRRGEKKRGKRRMEVVGCCEEGGEIRK